MLDVRLELELELAQSHMAQKPLCEARRREVVVICGCGNGLARDAPEASKVDGGLRAGGPQGLQAKPGGDTRPRANHRPRVDDGRDPAEFRCMQPMEGIDLNTPGVLAAAPRPRAQVRDIKMQKLPE